MLQKLKQCEEEQNEIANRINNIHKSCLGIKREGVSILQSEGKLISYLRVLSKNERNSVGLLDLGLGDIINDINKDLINIWNEVKNNPDLKYSLGLFRHHCSSKSDVIHL